MVARVSLLAFLAFAVCMSGARPDKDSIFSCAASSIWSGANTVVPSPDGKKKIIIGPPNPANSEETHRVAVRIGSRTFPTTIGALVNAEAAWSPHSKAFFVTYSDGGDVGTYRVRVYYATDAGIRWVEPITNGRRLLTPNCFDPEVPNVGAIEWFGAGSDELAVAIQVPPHSSCAAMGTFRAFIIRVPSGAIVAAYSQVQAKKLFSNAIGPTLQDADNACAEKPQTCIPCGMKGGRCAH